MPVAIVTDTTHYMPRQTVEEAGLHEVSLYVNDGGTSQRESEMPNFDAFYERLRSQSELPTTSQPSIGDFLAVYEPLVETGHDVVSVHLSGEISGTCDAARQAAADLASRATQRRIEVVDTKTACAGQGLIALAAAAAARSGQSVEQVVARAQAATEQTKIWFALDTLEYVRRGGRIGAASAWLGGALRIKPILTIQGTVLPVERVRTDRRAFERMVDYLRARQADGATAWAVQHIQAREAGERLVEAGRELFGTDPVIFSEVGPVIGTYAGPGMLGVSGLDPALLS